MNHTPTKSIAKRKIIFFALFALLEIGFVVLLLIFARRTVPSSLLATLELIFRGIGILFALYIIFIRKDRSEYRFLWLLLLIIEPMVGSVFYLLFAEKTPPSRFRKVKKEHISYPSAKIDFNISDKMKMLATFLSNTQAQKVYDSSKVEIFMPCDDIINVLLNDIRTATDYILLETFIMSSGRFLTLLLDEIENHPGLKIYFYVDDFGSFSGIKRSDVKRIRSLGINFVRYNKVSLLFRSSSNYRNHRKIIVIDGKVAYTGGANIADEYLNWKSRFGHWLDCFLRIEGECVKSFVECFKSDWESLTSVPFSLPESLQEKEVQQIEDKASFCNQLQFYTSSPTTQKDISCAEEVLISLILSARKRIFIITPYLSLTPLVYNSLLFAANSGVDVEIIIPGIPDKNLVYLATLNTAEKLVKNSINIYIYEKGFTHAKLIIIDDDCVNVSSINFDYRSFYFSFEAGVNIYTPSFCKECEERFLSLRAQCSPFKVKAKKLNHKIAESFALILRSYF